MYSTKKGTFSSDFLLILTSSGLIPFFFFLSLLLLNGSVIESTTVQQEVMLAIPKKNAPAKKMRYKERGEAIEPLTEQKAIAP